jgi:TatA/E family protein of Tat protein translocase
MTSLAFLRPNPEELILLLLLILLLFGAKRIPDLARALGRSIGEFKKGRAEGEREARAGDGVKPPSDGKNEKGDAAPTPDDAAKPK